MSLAVASSRMATKATWKASKSVMMPRRFVILPPEPLVVARTFEKRLRIEGFGQLDVAGSASAGPRRLQTPAPLHIVVAFGAPGQASEHADRTSTRLNSSH